MPFAFFWPLLIPIHLNVSQAAPPPCIGRQLASSKSVCRVYCIGAGSTWMVGDLRWISFAAPTANELGEEGMELFFFLAACGLFCAWIIEFSVMDRKPSHQLLLDTYELRNAEGRVYKDGYKETFVPKTFLALKKIIIILL